MLETLDEWWSQRDESGGIPAEVLAKLAVRLSAIEGVLAASSPSEGTQLAAECRREVLQLLAEAA